MTNLTLRIEADASQAKAELDRLQSSVSSFAREASLGVPVSGIDNLGKSANESSTALRKTESVLGDVRASLIGLAATAAGIGIGTLFTDATRELMTTQRELAATSVAFNVNAESIQAWQAAAKPLGIEADKMSDIMKDVNDKLGDFATTGGGEAKDLFETLNLKIKDFEKLAPDQALLRIGDALNKSGLTQSQKIFLLEGLADDASRLLPLLKDNGAAIATMRQTLQGNGTLLSTTELDTLAEANKSLSTLQSLWKGVETQAGLAGAAMLVAVQPEITNSINKLSTSWAFFKDDLIFSDDTFFIGLREIGKAIDTIATAIEPAMPYITEFATSFGIALAVLAGVAGIGALVSGALGMIGTAFTAVGAIIMANPVALTIAAIAGAGYLIYKNWDGIPTFAASTWGSVKSTVSSAWDSITKTVSNSTIGKQLNSLWGEVTATFGPLVTGYINLQKSLWSGIGSLASTGMSAIGSAVSDGWETVKLTFISYAPALRDAFDSAWSGLSNIASAAWQSITAVIGAAWDTVRGLLTAGLRLLRGDFSGAWDAIMETVRSLGQRMQDYFAGLPALMIGYGRDIVMGLARGISAAGDAAVAEAKAIASRVAGSVKGFFGIQSPSKLMQEYGENIGDGLAIGIKNNDKAAAEAKKKAKGIADAYADELKRINSELAKAGLGTKDQYKLDAGAKGFSNTQSNQLAEKQMAAEFAKITSQNKETIQQLKLTETGYFRAKLARDGFTKSQIDGLTAQKQEIAMLEAARQSGGWASYLQNMTSQAAQSNKTMFEINKAAAIANALLNTREAVTSAYKVGARFGGPPLGAAFAGVALAAQMANVRAIASQSFGGGGSADAGGGGSASVGGGDGGGSAGASSSAAAPVAQGGSVMIALQGNDNTQYSKKQVRDLIRQINEAVGDGARLAVA